jgi:hypothetical protein
MKAELNSQDCERIAAPVRIGVTRENVSE